VVLTKLSGKISTTQKVTNNIVVDTGDTASMFECILEECNLLVFAVDVD